MADDSAELDGVGVGFLGFRSMCASLLYSADGDRIGKSFRTSAQNPLPI